MALTSPLLLFLIGAIPTVESEDFAKELQRKAVAATVRIVSVANKHEGSGVVVGQGGGFVYILTAQHLIGRADKLEVHVYSQDSYPKPASVYRSVKVLAEDKDQDLALLRLATADRMPDRLRICPADSIPNKKQFSALAVGCDFGQAPSCVVDEVQDKKRVRRRAGDPPVWIWEMKQRSAKGRSGGPLIDTRGYVLGICSGRSDEHGYFATVEGMHQFLKDQGFKWLFAPPADD